MAANADQRKWRQIRISGVVSTHVEDVSTAIHPIWRGKQRKKRTNGHFAVDLYRGLCEVPALRSPLFVSDRPGAQFMDQFLERFSA